MTYKVDKGIPIPQTSKFPGLSDAVKKLKQNESVLHPGKKDYQRVKSLSYQTAGRAGFKVSVRTVKDGIRIWRM